MSSLIERLRSRAAGALDKPLFNRVRPKAKSRQSIVSNRFDELAWNASRPTRPIDSLIGDLLVGDDFRPGGRRKAYEPGAELVRDLYMALYKASPRLEDRRFVDREVYPNRKILEEMLASEDLQKLQEFTTGDAAMTTMALSSMGDQIRDIIARVPPPPPPPPPPAPGAGGAGKAGEGEQDSQEGEGQPGAPGADDGEDADGEGQGEPDFDPDGDDGADEAEMDWQAAYDDALKDLNLDRSMSNAIEAATDDAEDLDDTRRGIGLEDGEWKSMSPEQRLNLAARLGTKEMRELASMVGRMKRYALGIKATRVVDVKHEAFTVETGNDLPRVLRSEFALLATKETTYEFYRRYLQGELLQFKLRGTEDVGKGPIVLLIDKSASMKGAKFNWALGVAEALRRFAADDGRDIYAIFFGNNDDRERFSFPQGKAPFEQVLTFLSCEANGGTQFDGVLTEGLERASTAFDTQGKGKADIVFITDGQARLDDEWIANFNTERNRVGVRVFSVFIGGAPDMANRPSPLALLSRLSDVAFPVSDLRPQSVREIFDKV